MKLNMLLSCSVVAACLFANVVDNAKAMEPEDTWNKPITPAMIQEGLETYQKYQIQQTSDLLALAQQEKDDEDSYKVKLFALHKLYVKSKTGEEMPLLLVNTLHNNNAGHIDILEWDGDKNYEIVDQETYNKGNGSLYFHERYCTSVEYQFMRRSGDDVKFYTDFQENSLTPLWYCHVGHIGTDAKYQNKGIAKIGLSELIKFAFHSTSIDFISAYINVNNSISQKTFMRNGFGEICTNAYEDNWYLSRAEWEMKRPHTVNSSF